MPSMPPRMSSVGGGAVCRHASAATLAGPHTIRVMTKLVGIIRSAERRTLETEAPEYEDARAELEAQVPEGWEIIQFKTVK